MKLYYYSGTAPNFGDDLNTWLWPQIMPEVIADGDAGELFLGIGSILSNKVPQAANKYVLGTGFGGYSPKPEVDDSWKFYFVRGPNTAAALGLDPALAITDAAILLRSVDAILEPAEKRFPVSFMPHWESAIYGAWKDVAEMAGVHLIDPRGTPEQVLEELKATELLVTEAMHGAIVGDALRVPWIPILPTSATHRFKWLDWCASLSIDYQPQTLGVSSVNEFVKLKGFDPFYPAELVKRVTGRYGGGADHFLKRNAAKRLRAIARMKPTLSSDSQCEMRTTQAVEKLEALRSDFRLGKGAKIPELAGRS
ncbi:MAG TPA: polysaccharide pyruvyl transferase family protein [Arsenicitalea sp.]|jgi:succinoglycan biosynthesis protein ExoV|nr:polysaccharide pyruvyl transferase family protein [Arsenicitalea sp.]